MDAGAPVDEAVAIANIPSLLPMLVQLGGDERWLEAPYRPTRARGMSDHDDAGLPPEVQQEIRDAAADAITAWLGGRPPAIPEPSEALLVRMLSVSMAQDVPAEYGPMLRQVFGLPAEQDADRPAPADAVPPPGFRAIVVGAGASGIAIGVELARLGVEYTILEKADAVGGTWWRNRYPGCGVDTPSHLYSYSFYDTYDWPAYFSLRDTLHDYFESAATDLGVRPRVRLRTEVLAAQWDEPAQSWEVDVRGADGAARTLRADVLISAVGAFARPVWPDVPGLDTFAGERAHTGDWPEDLDVTGKRVAVIGNGASAMQVVPAIVRDAAEVHVYQRSPQWIVPFEKFQTPVPDPLRWLLTTVPLYRLWYRLRLFWNFNDKLHPTLQRDPAWPHPERSLNEVNDRHREFFTRYIEGELGDRQDLLPKVLPTYPPYGKRMLFDNGWYRALRRDDVTLAADGAAEVRPHAVVAGDGVEREVDVLVAATGFDVVRFLGSMEVRGRSGRTIREIWDDDDAQAYLGTVVPDLPNFFCLYGPNLQPGHGGSFIVVLEQQTGYVRRMLEEMFRAGAGSIECRRDVHDAYNAEVDAAHASMVWTHPGMSTYYRNARGRVTVNSPFRNVDFHHFMRASGLDDYVVEPRRGSAAEVA
ncbi:flavin-containing monooxygenase [Actinomycetospora flava]|uniref:NAD(P)/FAD-dependent oxidoreductase n=1 Tax=Actinomycetospora flava TaxID=3129232 RepID=A0ABU8M2W6_9PSEU